VHRQVRRAEFVEATIRALAKHGPDVGMDEIAAEAGVSKPVLYRHFNDKADLYLAVGMRATEILMAQIVPALENDGTIRERIWRTVDCFLRYVDDYQELYRFLVFRPDPTKSAVVLEDRNKIASVLSGVLNAYLELFQLDTLLAGPSAHGLVGLVQGTAEWWLDHHSEITRQRLTDHLTSMIWYGIDGILRAGGIVLDPNAPLTLPERPQPDSSPERKPAHR
jgi:AcrR family transcriptional regulator